MTNRPLASRGRWSLVVLAAFGCLTVGLAPFRPKPHILEKLELLWRGQLAKGIDILDLVFHGAPWLLLVAALGYALAPTLRR